MNNRVCIFLTLFYKLYKHRVIAAHCQPKAILIFLDDDTTLHKPCESNRQEREGDKGMERCGGCRRKDEDLVSSTQGAR